MAAPAKVQRVLADGGELMRGRVGAGRGAQAVEAQRVEARGVGEDGGVERDGHARDFDDGVGGDELTG